MSLPNKSNALDSGSYAPKITIFFGKFTSFFWEISVYLQEKDRGTLNMLNAFELTQKEHPNLKEFRKVLFWDTDLDKIDWTAHKRYVVNRVFSRGNEREILETIRFYGKGIIYPLLDMGDRYALHLKENVKKYLQNAE